MPDNLFGTAAEAMTTAVNAAEESNAQDERSREATMRQGSEASAQLGESNRLGQKGQQEQQLAVLQSKLDQAQNMILITPPIAVGLARHTGDREWLKSIGQKLPAQVYTSLYTQGIYNKIAGRVWKIPQGDKELSVIMNPNENGDFSPEVIGEGARWSPTQEGQMTPSQKAKLQKPVSVDMGNNMTQKFQPEFDDQGNMTLKPLGSPTSKFSPSKGSSSSPDKDMDKWFKTAQSARKEILSTFTKKGGMPASGKIHDIVSFFHGGDPGNDAKIAALKQTYSDYQTAVQNYNSDAEQTGKAPIQIDPQIQSAMDKILALPGAKGQNKNQSNDQTIIEYLKKINARDTPANRKWAEEQLAKPTT